MKVTPYQKLYPKINIIMLSETKKMKPMSTFVLPISARIPIKILLAANDRKVSGIHNQ